MGTTGCKPTKSAEATNGDEDDESVTSLSLGKGVRVHQLEGNNFLGRLDDAGRMNFRGRGLWRRHSSNATATLTGTATGGSSSARSSCYSDLSSSVWQHQQQHLSQQRQRLLKHQHFLSTAPVAASGGVGPPSSRSLDCGQAEVGLADDRRNSSSPDADADGEGADPDASRMDLTTLLLQGFDPAAYEQRLAERRLAKFTRRPPRSMLKAATAKATTAETEAAIATALPELPG